MGVFVRPLYLFLVGIMVIFSEGQDAGGGCVTSKQQDIILVLDSSTSIARADFTKQLAFVNSLIDRIDIGPDANQVGVISFSNNHRLNFHLNKNREKEQLKKSITAIRQMGGNTYTHKPLEYVRKYMFTTSRGDRLDKDNVCVVITDGKSSDPEKTVKAAKALAADGVQMFALGVGPAVDSEELADIAGSPERVFRAISYDELNDISHMFSRTVLGTCELATTTAAPIPPPIITGMDPEPYTVGEKINLRCSSETIDPTVELSWYKGGVLVPGTSYQVEGNFVVSMYSFDAESKDDGKQVECVLKHSSVSTDMRDTETIQVKAEPGPPVIVYDSGNTFYTDDLVKLTCYTETEDPGQTDVIWFLNGEVIEGTKLPGAERLSNSIVFPAELSHNIARFECWVKFLGFPEPLIDYAEITVKPLPGRPIITADPAGPLATGDRVTLSCTSNGTDSYTKVTWYRDNREVDTSFTIGSTSIRNDLTMTALNKEYECRVSHPRIDDDMVAVHRLIVYTTPDKPVIKGPTSSLSPNEPVTLECTSENADVFATLVWKKNGIIIDEDFELLDSDVISNAHRFSSVEEARGSRCEVNHKYLPAPEYAIPRIRQRTVLPGPPIINEGKSITPVVEGSQVQLRCRSLGTDSDTAVTWYKNGRVDGNSYAIEGDSVVNTISVRASDRDEYECRVTHRELTVPLSDTIGIPILAMPENPVITGVPPSPVTPGTLVTLRCQSRGTSPETKLFWYKRGELVDDSHSISGSYVVNEYTFRADQDHSELQCRLTFPPTGYTAYETATVAIEGMPGDPTITGAPTSSVTIGYRTRLVCRSAGTSPSTQLVWYEGGRMIDNSYSIVGNYVVNEYEFFASKQGLAELQCRLRFPPGDLDLSAYSRISVKRPDAPTIDQVPTPVWQDQATSLICRVRHDGSRDMKLEWYVKGELVDRTQYEDGSFLINKYDVIASDPKQIYECRLSPGSGDLVTVEHQIEMRDPLPHPIISGSPQNPVNPGDRFNLTCTWHKTGDAASLYWRNALTKQVQPSMVEYDPDKLVSHMSAVANDTRLIIYDCLVDGVTTGKDNDTLVDRVKVKVNDPEPTEECSGRGTQLDLVVILDSSTSIIRPDFSRQVEFVSSFASEFDIGPDGVQIGIVSFSSRDEVNFYMDEHSSKETLQTAISEIKQIGGGTSTHLPIQRAREEMFTALHGDRPDVPNVCIVLTDGKSYDVDETHEQARLTREAGIDIYVIGVGTAVDFDELTAIAGDSDRVYFSEDYGSLKAIEQDFVKATKSSTGPCPRQTIVTDWSEWSACSATCGAGTHTRTRSCQQGNDNVKCPTELRDTRECIEKICDQCVSISQRADIAFLLDTSSSVYEPDFDKMKSFLVDFIDLFNISESQQRIASLTFSDEVKVNFHLGDFRTNDDVKAALLRIPMHLGGTRTHDAIKFARQELFSEINGARRNSAKLAFIITDGRSYNPEQTSIEAQIARHSGIIMYSIGIGPETDRSELERIAGKAAQVYHVASYDDIAQLKRKIGVELGRCIPSIGKIDGGYGSWGRYSPCSVTCGVGIKTRTRRCDSPVPRNGGKECEGMSIHTKRCKMPQCGSRPVPRGWTDWEFSSRCSASCGEGTQEVTRYCQYNDGCRLGEEEHKVVKCQLAHCDPVGNKCGGETGLNVMFASQGINSNGPNSYFAVELIANATASIAVDGKHIRTSLTLSDCTCGKNTGYDLSRYRNFEDIYNHLHDLDLGDTASLLRKVKSENNIMPSFTRGRAFSDNRHQVLVYVFDANDVITEKAVEEAEKLKMAGVTIYAAVLHRDADIGRIRQIVSRPADYYMSQVESNEQSGSRYVNELSRKLCSVRK